MLLDGRREKLAESVREIYGAIALFLSAILGLRSVSSPYHNKSCSQAVVVFGIRAAAEKV